MLRLRDGKYRSQLLNLDMSHKVKKGMYKKFTDCSCYRRGADIKDRGKLWEYSHSLCLRNSF